jgi:hypothetical protein
MRPKSPFGGLSFSFRVFVLLDVSARKPRKANLLGWLAKPDSTANWILKEKWEPNPVNARKAWTGRTGAPKPRGKG